MHMDGRNEAVLCNREYRHLQRIQQKICANCWVPLLLGLPCKPHIQVAGASSAARAAYNDVPPVPVSALVAPCATHCM